MAEAKAPNSESAPSLPDRAARYREEAERVVREVGEHPLYELKRSCSFSLLKDRIEFVKDIQSIATSRIETEKFLVIGADDSTHSFYSVQNVAEFDDATVRQLLEKYLSPVPDFEVFQLTSTDGHAFVVFMIPKQKQRRILARVTVEDVSETKPKVLLREGDLWTKGSSTGKRLAKPEDWDEIYEEVIEREAERRARERTAHSLDLVLAREKVRVGTGTAALPSYFTDAEFQALMEELCATQNEAKFNLLLERLRDELIEAWENLGAYDHIVPTLPQKVKEHAKNVFRPNVHWLTLAGLYVVKNSGPLRFLEAVIELLRELFESSDRLTTLRAFAPHGTTVSNSEEHISHTVPALESLVSLHLIGAYVHKRKRFQYSKLLLRPVVHRMTVYNAKGPRIPMALWPLGSGQGEPNELQFRAGRINFCVTRIGSTSTYLKLFGSAKAATTAICQYEFCLELNSHLAVNHPESVAYVGKAYPGIEFYFWPSFIAFNFEHIYEIAAIVFAEVKKGQPDILKLILFDSALANVLTDTNGEATFVDFLGAIHQEQSKLFFELSRFPPIVFWPDEIRDSIKKRKEVKQAQNRK